MIKSCIFSLGEKGIYVMGCGPSPAQWKYQLHINKGLWSTDSRRAKVGLNSAPMPRSGTALQDLWYSLQLKCLFHDPSSPSQAMKEPGVPFINISAPSVISGMSSKSEKTLCDMFEEAKRVAPCLLFIDEIDAISPKQESTQKEMYTEGNGEVYSRAVLNVHGWR